MHSLVFSYALNRALNHALNYALNYALSHVHSYHFFDVIFMSFFFYLIHFDFECVLIKSKFLKKKFFFRISCDG